MPKLQGYTRESKLFPQVQAQEQWLVRLGAFAFTVLVHIYLLVITYVANSTGKVLISTVSCTDEHVQFSLLLGLEIGDVDLKAVRLTGVYSHSSALSCHPVVHGVLVLEQPLCVYCNQCGRPSGAVG